MLLLSVVLFMTFVFCTLLGGKICYVISYRRAYYEEQDFAYDLAIIGLQISLFIIGSASGIVFAFLVAQAFVTTSIVFFPFVFLLELFVLGLFFCLKIGKDMKSGKQDGTLKTPIASIPIRLLAHL